MKANLQVFFGFVFAAVIAFGGWLTVRIGTALFSQQNKRPKIDIVRWRYLIGTAISSAMFMVLNAIDPPSLCVDCDVHRGRPFPLWHEGGFLHDPGILWGGILADVLVIICAAMLLAYLIGLYDRE